ncbi:MAG: HD domain-containing protein [Lachnospiraceae bacterium]|nr:HD domain-containing protein [Lachnospiraceae bacterium]
MGECTGISAGQLLAAAELIASMAHRGQLDKGGVPYIEHPRAVAAMVETEEEKTVAMLHDVLEDTYLTEEDLRPVFGDRITDAVLKLTHDESVPYMDYIKNLADDPIAVRVKIADLTHNMDEKRIPPGDDYTRARIENFYKPAYAFLRSINAD